MLNYFICEHYSDNTEVYLNIVEKGRQVLEDKSIIVDLHYTTVDDLQQAKTFESFEKANNQYNVHLNHLLGDLGYRMATGTESLNRDERCSTVILRDSDGNDLLTTVLILDTIDPEQE